jgi:flagellum-specific ATP synthase
MAIYDENEKLINVGAYHTGTNALIDNAIAKHDSIENFLMQGIGEKAAIRDTLVKLGELASVTIPEEELPEEASLADNEE